eukprot:gene13950-17814_t
MSDQIGGDKSPDRRQRAPSVGSPPHAAELWCVVDLFYRR